MFLVLKNCKVHVVGSVFWHSASVLEHEANPKLALLVLLQRHVYGTVEQSHRWYDTTMYSFVTWPCLLALPLGLASWPCLLALPLGLDSWFDAF